MKYLSVSLACLAFLGCDSATGAQAQVDTVVFDMIRTEAAGSVVLAAGQAYRVRASGRYSEWSRSVWSGPTCGNPESTSEGLVGIDPAYGFGAPNESASYCTAVLPLRVEARQLSLDGGATWFAIDMPYQSDHVYEFPVTGQGYPLQVRNTSYPLDDNYGTLRYEVLADAEETAAEPTGADLPAGYVMSLLHPNPFAGQATLRLRLAQAQRVRVAAYDVLGREVAVLHEGTLAADEHAFTFRGGALQAGTYVVRVVGESFAGSRRAVLLK